MWGFNTVVWGYNYLCGDNTAVGGHNPVCGGLTL